MLVFKNIQTQWRLCAQRGKIWSRTKYMVNKLIWIMNLGEFRANCIGREGQAINNLPCRGSLQITAPPLCLLVFCHSSFFPLPSVTYLLPLFFSCPSFCVAVRRSAFQTDRPSGRSWGWRASMYSFIPHLSLSLLQSLTCILTVGGGKYLKRRLDRAQPL